MDKIAILIGNLGPVTVFSASHVELLQTTADDRGFIHVPCDRQTPCQTDVLKIYEFYVRHHCHITPTTPRPPGHCTGIYVITRLPTWATSHTQWDAANALLMVSTGVGVVARQPIASVHRHTMTKKVHRVKARTYPKKSPHVLQQKCRQRLRGRPRLWIH